MKASFRKYLIAGLVLAGWSVAVQPSQGQDQRLIAQIRAILKGHFTAPDGSVRQFSDFKAKVVLINFWASWCPNCIEELASLKKMQQTLGRDNIQVILVGYPDDWAAEQQFAKTHGIDFPIYEFAPSSQEEIDAAFSNYGGMTLPQTVIWDAEGWEKLKVTGAIDWSIAEYTAKVRKILTCPGDPKVYAGQSPCGD